MQRLLLLITAISAFSSSSLFAEEVQASSPTQRDWLVNLVEGMGWSFGLPEEPRDADYLAIMSGERTFRIEAEDAKDETDPVSVKNFNTFGPYSGRGWVNSSTSPATLHLRFLLPASGHYSLSASVRLEGIEVLVKGKNFRLPGSNRFTIQDAGKVELAAGEHEIIVQLPPNSSIDYIDLKAPSLPAISPLEGWQLDTPLTSENLAITTIQLLGLEELVPLSHSQLSVEAESSSDIGTAERTEIRHLGAPSDKRWIRAGAAATKVKIDFTLPETGLYTIALRGEGGTPLSGEINGKHPFNKQFPLFLKTLDIGTWFLKKGENSINVSLPPRGGIDLLTVTSRGEKTKQLHSLVGLKPEEEPTTATMNTMISLLSVLVPPR